MEAYYGLSTHRLEKKEEPEEKEELKEKEVV